MLKALNLQSKYVQFNPVVIQKGAIADWWFNNEISSNTHDYSNGFHKFERINQKPALLPLKSGVRPRNSQYFYGRGLFPIHSPGYGPFL